jgi:hypothetical protein
MGSKPRKKPAKRKFEAKNFDPTNLSKSDLLEICAEMASVIRLTAGFGKFPEGFTFSGGEDGHGIIEKASVTERAFECLDSIGQIVDRDRYYADKTKKSRKKKQ